MIIDHHEAARRVEVLGEGTQAQRRAALVERLKRELRERFNYLPERSRMWRPAAVLCRCYSAGVHCGELVSIGVKSEAD